MQLTMLTAAVMTYLSDSVSVPWRAKSCSQLRPLHASLLATEFGSLRVRRMDIVQGSRARENVMIFSGTAALAVSEIVPADSHVFPSAAHPSRTRQSRSNSVEVSAFE